MRIFQLFNSPKTSKKTTPGYRQTTSHVGEGKNTRKTFPITLTLWCFCSFLFIFSEKKIDWAGKKKENETSRGKTACVAGSKLNKVRFQPEAWLALHEEHKTRWCDRNGLTENCNATQYNDHVVTARQTYFTENYPQHPEQLEPSFLITWGPPDPGSGSFLNQKTPSHKKNQWLIHFELQRSVPPANPVKINAFWPFLQKKSGQTVTAYWFWPLTLPRRGQGPEIHRKGAQKAIGAQKQPSDIHTCFGRRKMNQTVSK